MKLTAFTEADKELLMSWVPSAEFNHLWSGDRFVFPLDNEQLSKHLLCEQVTPLILQQGEKKLGYIELYHESESTYRLCRVLIGEPSIRGQGCGKKMVELAEEYARTTLNAKHLKLTVFEHNLTARRCYESLGFTVCERESGFKATNGDLWTALYMKKLIT
ncbi:GNAT family N-acetyltransferase [Photobacterium rosenbergii]|uniref:GNAT family N-acetyltransferase n=1 Tax=Photobacterium rosenbergii TaxID=294936 RepID=A0A2T3NLF0_9GAMM|nr:GNAT family N-acetyltransferase [Photobacterium rosenbergii]PSW16354.1 GNAT family N-acetyltransferase [Photobacterium rosenbergii]